MVYVPIVPKAVLIAKHVQAVFPAMAFPETLAPSAKTVSIALVEQVRALFATKAVRCVPTLKDAPNARTDSIFLDKNAQGAGTWSGTTECSLHAKNVKFQTNASNAIPPTVLALLASSLATNCATTIACLAKSDSTTMA